MQTVRELDENYTCILGDREKELTIILDLPVLRRIERQMTNLREAVDDLGDFFSELALDFFDGDRGVFDDIVNEPARDGYRIELEVRKNFCDFNTVLNEILAGESLLTEVRGFAEPIGAQKQLLIKTIGEPLAAIVPSGDNAQGFDRRHSSPASAKLR